MNGGEGGIRTHGTLARSPVFKTGAFDHSATSPCIVINYNTTKKILIIYIYNNLQ